MKKVLAAVMTASMLAAPAALARAPEQYQHYGSEETVLQLNPFSTMVAYGGHEIVIADHGNVVYFGGSAVAVSGAGGTNTFVPQVVYNDKGQPLPARVKVTNFKFVIGNTNNDRIYFAVTSGQLSNLHLISENGNPWVCYQGPELLCIGGDAAAAVKSLGGINQAIGAGLLYFDQGGKG